MNRMVIQTFMKFAFYLLFRHHDHYQQEAAAAAAAAAAPCVPGATASKRQDTKRQNKQIL
jgi:hypothetical protein